MKILHLFPAFKNGGAPINTLRFISQTTELDHYVSGKFMDKVLVNQYVKKIGFLKCFNIDLTRFSLKSIFSLIKITKRHQPDIIHCNGKGGAVYGLILYVTFYKKFKYVYTLRGFHVKWNGLKKQLYLLFEKITNLVFNKIITVSHSETEYYSSLIKVKNTKVVCIPNGIEVKESEVSEPIKNKLLLFQKNILSISRISHQKDIVTMLLAFDKLNDLNVALHIIGGYIKSDIEYKRRIFDLWESLSSKNRIFFWGDVNSSGNLIHNFDIYWSTAIFEGLPTAVIEAGLSKTPIIATDCRGNIDIIKDNETGFLTRMNDIEHNYEKLQMVLYKVSEAQKIEICNNAYQLCKNYSIQNNSDRLRRLYHHIV